jgi:hypothetical protein
MLNMVGLCRDNLYGCPRPLIPTINYPTILIFAPIVRQPLPDWIIQYIFTNNIHFLLFPQYMVVKPALPKLPLNPKFPSYPIGLTFEPPDKLRHA